MKIEYDMSSDDEYVDIWVWCAVRNRDWEMHMFRNKHDMTISKPAYRYSPSRSDPFEETKRIPKRVQRYFDDAVPKAKTLLILGSN